jgi:hypothetical protein
LTQGKENEVAEREEEGIGRSQKKTRKSKVSKKHRRDK